MNGTVVYNGSLLSYTKVSLATGTLYSFSISAYNNAGSSAYSTDLYQSTLDFPSAPTNLAGAANDSAVVLTWSPPASDGGKPVVSYRIDRDNQLVFNGSAVTFTDSPLAPFAKYQYKIAAINAIGQGPFTSINVTTLDTPKTGICIFW